MLLDTIDVLKALKIPYAVIGAFAVACYGVPRLTDDGDGVIWLRQSTTTIQGLRDRFAVLGYRAEVRFGEFEDPILESIRLDDKFGNRVDFLSSVRGMDADAAQRRVIAPILDTSVEIIGAEDLIGMKLYAGGPQDLLDVQGILQVWRERLDPDLLQKVAHGYGSEVSRTLEELLKDFPLN